MFAVFYPLIFKRCASETLKLFISQYGAPKFLTFDGVAEQCKRGILFMKQVSIHNIKHHLSERNHSNQNGAEGVIRDIQRRRYRIMNNKHIPQRLWYYGIN